MVVTAKEGKAKTQVIQTESVRFDDKMKGGDVELGSTGTSLDSTMAAGSQSSLSTEQQNTNNNGGNDLSNVDLLESPTRAIRRKSTQSRLNARLQKKQSFGEKKSPNSTTGSPRARYFSFEIESAKPQKPEKVYHSLHNKRKVLLKQVLPFIIAFFIYLRFRVEVCREVAKQNDDDDDKNDSCVNETAETTKMLNYIIVMFCCYQIRKELMENRNLLFHNVDGIKMGLFGYIMVGTDKDKETNLKPQGLVDMILGQLPLHRRWNIRGHWIVPLFISISYACYYVDYARNEVAGVTNIGYLIPYLISTFCYIFIINFLVLYNLKTSLFPAIVLGYQVGVTSKDRISLWNTSDLALGELQRISMHASIYATLIVVYVLLNFIVFSDYFDITTLFLVFICVINLSLTFMAVFVPILPVIMVLREKKESVYGDVLVIVERCNDDYLSKLQSGVDASQEKANLDNVINYLTYVKATTVLPSSLEVIRTSLFSIVMTILPVLIVSMLIS
mmetsp:Transcript_5411/g.7039  ORF Transcript_5411/g.7039 Transcript_5411/m.7039 type:complete len:503 (+) Transcript_5411:62-1570(+)